MKSKKASLLKKSFFLTLILFLVLVFAFTCQVLAARIIDENFEVTGAYGYDMAGWTEVVDPGCTLNEDAAIPGTAPTGAGNQCLKAVVSDATNNDAYAVQTKTDQNISYVRGYLYVAQEGLNDGQVLSTLGLFTGANERVACIQIGQSTGLLKLRFQYYSNGTLNNTGMLTIALNTWYRVDYLYDITNLDWHVRIDGIIKASGKLVAPTRTSQKMITGILGNEGAASSMLYTDLVVWEDFQDTTRYVDADNPNPMYPYDTQGTAATTIMAAVYACESATIYVKKATNQYFGIIMKSNTHIIGRNETWGPTAPDHSDCPIVPGTPAVTFKGPLDNCTLEGFKLEVGSTDGQIDIDGGDGPVTNVTIRDCWLYHPGQQGVQLIGDVSCTIEACDIEALYQEDSGVAGIATPKGPSIWLVSDAGSPIVIKETRIHGFHSAGIVLSGDGAVGITIQDSDIYDNGYAGIRLIDFGSVTIDKNNIYNNGRRDKGGILIQSLGTATITRNDICDNGKAGVRIEGNSNVTVGASLEAVDPFDYGNDIHGNYAGIFFDNDMSGDFVIRGNYIYNNSGGAFEGGGIQLGTPGTATITISENDIIQNELGGIGIKGVSSTPGETCTVVITKNNIHDNIKGGGIHTGDKTGHALGNSQNADFTIKQNKVHHNYNASYGGGIDVRHASGIIKNNLVYENARGGIRIGKDITEVINNTVVWNGFNNTYGGGIVYDDPTTGALNAQPDRIYNDPTLPLIKNNICAFNKKAGIGVVFDNSGYERNYNLLYDNWYGETILGYNYGDCSWTGWPGCKKRQIGGSWPVAPNEIFGDPLFVDMVSDDYHLDVGSPAIGTGEGGVDMGAYGGPDAIDDNDFPTSAYVHYLIDGDTSTGNTPAGGRNLFFDLGGTYWVRRVRLYGSAGNTYSWTIYVGDTTDGCTDDTWGTSVLTDGYVGGASQWYEGNITDAQGSHIKIRSNTTINEYSIFEFQFTNVDAPTEEDWLTPVSVVEGCTDIYGLCK